MKSALILSGNLVQDHEFIYPYYRLLEEKFNLDVSLLGGQPVQGILGTRIPPNKDQNIINIEEVKISNYNLLIIPGGAKAMEYLRQDKAILNIIKEFNDNNITIGSICHGAQLLISAKVVAGKKISGYYSIEDDINNAGATYSSEPAVQDKNIISSPHYKYLGDWMSLILQNF
mgnify:FL=1